MDVHAIKSAMDEAVQYYKDMSWGQMLITYELLPQRRLTVSSASPKLTPAKKACEQVVSNQGYKQGVDYDGIIFLYHTAQSGQLQNSGAKGQMNGDFIWASSKDITYGVFRHEIGHNLGHDHHGRNAYNYRTTRPYFPGVTDGFDMASFPFYQNNVTSFTITI